MQIFIKFHFQDQIKKHPAVAEKWNQIVLDKTWTYSLLLVLFYNVEVNPDLTRVMETELSEKEIISSNVEESRPSVTCENSLQVSTIDST